MIDTFSILLAHGLLLLAAWRLLKRPDLDQDDADPFEKQSSGWGKPDDA
jgi:hypothetical protein